MRRRRQDKTKERPSEQAAQEGEERRGEDVTRDAKRTTEVQTKKTRMRSERKQSGGGAGRQDIDQKELAESEERKEARTRRRRTRKDER